MQHEWLKMSTKRAANAVVVERFIDILESYSLKLMDTVINLTDQNVRTDRTQNENSHLKTCG